MVKGLLEVPTKWGKDTRQHLSKLHFQAWWGQGLRSFSMGQGMSHGSSWFKES